MRGFSTERKKINLYWEKFGGKNFWKGWLHFFLQMTPDKASVGSLWNGWLLIWSEWNDLLLAQMINFLQYTRFLSRRNLFRHSIKSVFLFIYRKILFWHKIFLKDEVTKVSSLIFYGLGSSFEKFFSRERLIFVKKRASLSRSFARNSFQFNFHLNKQLNWIVKLYLAFHQII